MSTADPNSRLMALEMAVAHLEHQLEQMHSVLLAVQAEMSTARETIMKLERRIQVATEPPEEREASLERPPHY